MSSNVHVLPTSILNACCLLSLLMIMFINVFISLGIHTLGKQPREGATESTYCER